MTPSPRFAAALAVVALTALLLPVWLPVAAALVLIAAAVYDALTVRRPARVTRAAPRVLARGTPAPLTLEAGPHAARVRVRQPRIPDLGVEPPEAEGALTGRVVAHRRGRHELPAPAQRLDGPLGLARWYHPAGEPGEILVYPDLPAGRRLAQAVRRGRFRGPGRLTRGPLGLGTDFESIREHVPDDDVRQVNWRATARLGRPMSNQFRVEQDRDVILVVDTGRLMAAPLGDRTRLDVALDAAAAVAAVADELGDRSGVLAFADEIRRSLRPRRAGAEAVVRAVFDLEPEPVDAAYELAFRAIDAAKRSFVLLLTDLVDESAARPLVDAVPVLARRHALVVASVRDPDLDAAIATPPERVGDVYAAAVALDVLDARTAAVRSLRRAGAEVVEAPADALPTACVGSYLSAKSRARL